MVSLVKNGVAGAAAAGLLVLVTFLKDTDPFRCLAGCTTNSPQAWIGTGKEQSPGSPLTKERDHEPRKRKMARRMGE